MSGLLCRAGPPVPNRWQTVGMAGGGRRLQRVTKEATLDRRWRNMLAGAAIIALSASSSFANTGPHPAAAMYDVTISGARMEAYMGIDGTPLPHLLYHFWLTFSGWQ